MRCGFDDRPGMPDRARGTRGRGGGGAGLGRRGLDVFGVVAFVFVEVVEAVVDEEDGLSSGAVSVILGLFLLRLGSEAQAIASSISSSSLSQETLMQRPTRRTVVSSG